MHTAEREILLPGDLARVSPDGSFVLSAPYSNDPQGSRAEYQHTVIWNTTDRKTRCSRACPEPGISWAEVSPDSKLIASFGINGSLEVWNAGSGIREHEINLPMCCIQKAIFSPDCKHIAVLVHHNATRSIDVYELAMGIKVSSFCGLVGEANSVAWSPSADLLAMCASKGTVHLWDPASGTERMRWKLRSLHMYAEEAHNIRFLNDGKKLVFSTSYGATCAYPFTSLVSHEFCGSFTGQLCHPTVWSSDGTSFVVLDRKSLMFWAPGWGNM
ncbi:hypothetical protein BJX99DRAFT_262468 [Aspergillus californicus]